MSNPLTILHIARGPVGGVFRHVIDLSTRQAEMGHRVGFVCDTQATPYDSARLDDLASKLPLGVTRLPMPRSISPADVSAILSVARHAAAIDPDVVHAHGAKGGVYGRLAGAMTRRKNGRTVSFYAPHGGSLHFDPHSMQGRVYFAVERGLERFTDGLIHVSRFEAGTYREKIGFPRCPAHVIHNGLRPEEFQPVTKAEAPADFLFLGMLRDLKGVDVMIEALADLKGRGLTPSALFVGDGETAEKARYRALIAQRGLEAQVRFEAPMPARGAFARGGCIVIPSRAESLPYVVLESVAAALPIVATDVGGIPEILSAEQDRLAVPGDPSSLADLMASYLAAPERQAAAAVLRRERIRELFSLDAMVQRTETIYRDALAGRYRAVKPAATDEVFVSR